MDVITALNESFRLGQEYWRLKDSERMKDWDKGDATMAQFESLRASMARQVYGNVEERGAEEFVPHTPPIEEWPDWAAYHAFDSRGGVGYYYRHPPAILTTAIFTSGGGHFVKSGAILPEGLRHSWLHSVVARDAMPPYNGSTTNQPPTEGTINEDEAG